MKRKRFKTPSSPATGRYRVEKLEERILFSADLAPFALGGPIEPADHLDRLADAANEDVAERNTITERTELVIIDSGVPELEQLIELLKAERGQDALIHILDSESDGLEPDQQHPCRLCVDRCGARVLSR